MKHSGFFKCISLLSGPLSVPTIYLLDRQISGNGALKNEGRTVLLRDVAPEVPRTSFYLRG